MTSPPPVHPPDDVAALEACVDAMVARYDWTAVTTAELVGCVLEARRTADRGTTDEALVHRCYRLRLYAACRSTIDPAAQSRGFRDLHRYLYRVAWNVCAGMGRNAVEYIAQAAVESVFLQIDALEHPEAFLKFAFDWLRAARKDYLRKEQKQHRIRQAIGHERTGSGLDRIRDADVRVCFGRLLEMARSLNPRQHRLLWLKYLEVTDKEIAAELGITENNVKQRWFQLRRQLREDPELRRCFDAIDTDETYPGGVDGGEVDDD